MLSGLSNLSKNNLSSTKYSKHYGINEEEMNLLLEHFGIDNNDAARIKNQYIGYKSNIGTAEEPNFIDKYNIQSIVNYFNSQSIRPHWECSCLVSSFVNILFKNKSFKETIENLLNGKNILIGKQIEDFDIDELKQLKAMQNGDNI